MKLFTRLMLWIVRFDLAIARSTGRNPTHIAQLQKEESEWELALFNETWRLK